MITLVGSWAGTSGPRDTTISTTVGAVTPGNIMVACTVTDGRVNIDSPPGFTLKGGGWHSTTAITTRLYVKRADSSDINKTYVQDVWSGDTAEIATTIMEFSGARSDSADIRDDIGMRLNDAGNDSILRIWDTTGHNIGDYGFWIVGMDGQQTITTIDSDHTEWTGNPANADNDACILAAFKDTPLTATNYNPPDPTASGSNEFMAFTLVLYPVAPVEGIVSASTTSTVIASGSRILGAVVSATVDTAVTVSGSLEGVHEAEISIGSTTSTNLIPQPPYARYGSLSITSETSVTALAYIQPSFTQESFRFREVGTQETDLTKWAAALDTDISLSPSSRIAIRFSLKELSDTTYADPLVTYKLQYSLNSGVYSDIPTTTTNEVFVEGIRAPINGTVATDQILSSGTYINGRSTSGTITLASSLQNASTDLEYIITLNNNLVATDTIDFRIVNTEANANPTYTYTKTPRITIIDGTKSSLTQASFRGRNDDGSETTATWIAAVNTNWIQLIDDPFRLRFLLQNTVTPAPNVQDEQIQLQYKIDAPLGELVTEFTLRPSGYETSRFPGCVAVAPDGLTMATSEIKASFVGTSRVMVYKDVSGTWSLIQTITQPYTSSTIGQWNNYEFGRSMAFNTDGSILVIADPQGGLYGDSLLGSLHTYLRTGDTFSLDDDYKLVQDGTYNAFMSRWSYDMEMTGDMTKLLARGWDVNSYAVVSEHTYSGGTWVYVDITHIGLGGGYDRNHLVMSDNGLTFAASEYINDTSVLWKFYDWNGGTTVWDYRGEKIRLGSFMSTIMLNSDASKILGVGATGTGYEADYGLHLFEENSTGSHENAWDHVEYSSFSDTFFTDIIDSEYNIETSDITPDLSTFIIGSEYGLDKVYTGIREAVWKPIKRGEAPLTMDTNYTIGTPPIEVITPTATTQQVGVGATFVSSEITDRGLVAFRWPSGTAETEIEYSLSITKEVPDASTVSFRLVSTEEQGTYNDALTMIPITYTNTPVLTVSNGIVSQLQGYRGRDDDGTEVTATWIETVNTEWISQRDDILRVRFLINNDNAPAIATAETYTVEYAHTGVTDPSYIYKKNVDIGGFSYISDTTTTRMNKVHIANGARRIATLSTSGSAYIYDYNDETYLYDTSVIVGRIGYHIAISEDGLVICVCTTSLLFAIYSISGSTATLELTITSVEFDSLSGKSVSLNEDGTRLVVSTETGTVRTYTIYQQGSWTYSDEGVTVGITNNFTMSKDGLVLFQQILPDIDTVDVELNGSVGVYDWIAGAWYLRTTIARSTTGIRNQEFGTAMTCNYDGSVVAIVESNTTFLNEYQGGADVGNAVIYSYNEGTGNFDYESQFVLYQDYSLDMSSDAEFIFTMTQDGSLRRYDRDFTWKTIGAQGTTVENVIYHDSTQVVDNTATTQQLGIEAFVAGEIVEAGTGATTWTTVGKETEHEIVIKVPSTLTAYGEFIRLRVIDSGGRPLIKSPDRLRIDTTYVIVPIVDQSNWRGRLDDNYENLATWANLINTTYDAIIGETTRVRFVLENTQVPYPLTAYNYKLQYNKNLTGTFSIGDRSEPTDTTQNMRYGGGVALSADSQVLAVGAWYFTQQTSGDGKVYIYDLQSDGTWLFRNHILGASGEGDYYGSDVSLSENGDWLLVGAERADVGATLQAGSAFLYSRNGSSWILDETVTAAWKHSDAEASAYFGSGVAISGDGSVMVVGAKYYNGGASNNRGKVYMFRKVGGTWTNDGYILLGTDANWWNGYAVTVSGDGSVLGFSLPVWGNGVIYFADYAVGVWTLRSYGLAGSVVTERFGIAMSMNRDGRVILIGSNANDGTYYVIDWDGFDTATSLTTRQSITSALVEGFADGVAIAADGAKVVIGAPAYSESYSTRGCIYTSDVDLSWQDVQNQSDTVSSIKYDNSAWITDGEVTTQQLSSPDTFKVGTVAESDYATVSWVTASESTELEYVIKTVIGKALSGDTYLLRVIQTDNNIIPQTHSELAQLFTYDATAFKEGEVSCVVDTSVRCSQVYEGIVSVTVDTTTTPNVQITGEVSNSADSTVTADASLILSGVVNALTKFYVTNEARLALHSTVNAFFGTRVNALGVNTLNASVDITADSNIVPQATNIVNGAVSISSTSSLDSTGIQQVTGIVDVLTGTTLTAIGKIFNEASTNCRVDMITNITGDLTLGAKCGIIIGSSVNINSVNEVTASLICNVTTSVDSVNSEITRNAIISVSSNSSSTTEAYRTRTATLNASTKPSVTIIATVHEGCEPLSTSVTLRINSTVVRERPNITTRYCP